MKKSNQLTTQNKILIVSIVIFIAVFSVLQLSKNKISKGTLKPRVESTVVQPDTLIPYGFVLVPITVANPDAVKALIDRFAVVDLYSENPPSLIAAKIKLIQAPLNSDQYAALVPEDESTKLMQHNGAFRVAVQPRKISSEAAVRPIVAAKLLPVKFLKKIKTTAPLIEYQKIETESLTR